MNAKAVKTPLKMEAQKASSALRVVSPVLDHMEALVAAPALRTISPLPDNPSSHTKRLELKEVIEHLKAIIKNSNEAEELRAGKVKTNNLVPVEYHLEYAKLIAGIRRQITGLVRYARLYSRTSGKFMNYWQKSEHAAFNKNTIAQALELMHSESPKKKGAFDVILETKESLNRQEAENFRRHGFLNDSITFRLRQTFVEVKDNVFKTAMAVRVERQYGAKSFPSFKNREVA